MRNFKNLEIWRRSMTLVKTVYSITNAFPKSEDYGLTAQIRRSGVSIPSNIAEGCGKRTTIDLARFLDIALGSSFELETQLIIAGSLGYGNSDELREVIEELNQIQKMINTYNMALRK